MTLPLVMPLTATGTDDWVVVPLPSWPSALRPQHLVTPSVWSAQVESPPAATAVAVTNSVAVSGWAEATDLDVIDLARRFEDAGVAAIIYTDIDRDGAMAGPNIPATAALARAVSIPVIASGGVSSLDDLAALKACGAPLDGVISGRALYEGKLDLAAALRLLED